ncbi:MAG: hypothetical protein ABI838_05045, partial [Chloroflexota bacterium]
DACAPPADEPAAAEAQTVAMPEPPAEAPPLEPVAAEPARPAAQSWSIVGQGGEEIPSDAPGAGGTPREEAAKRADKKEKRAAWDVIPHSRGKHEEVNLLMGQDAPKETIGMTLLSYAGLVGALVVVLLGVLLMVATTR